METTSKTAAQLEAEGAAVVTFDYRGAAVTIPLAIELWPCEAIVAGRVAHAVRALLAGNTAPVMRTRGDVFELSHRMADAAGVSPLPESSPIDGVGFGAVPLLLALLAAYPDDIASDLRRFYGVDYADRWRADPPLTLRQIWVYMRRLPADSSLAVARNRGREVWRATNYQLADLWSRWSGGARYPGRPVTEAEAKALLAKVESERAENQRLADRESYYASGQNMRDAGIDTDGMAFADPGHMHPPHKGDADPAPSTPFEAALAVARRNAARTPQPRKASPHGRQRAEFHNGRYQPAGSGWG